MNHFETNTFFLLSFNKNHVCTFEIFFLHEFPYCFNEFPLIKAKLVNCKTEYLAHKV